MKYSEVPLQAVESLFQVQIEFHHFALHIEYQMVLMSPLVFVCILIKVFLKLIKCSLLSRNRYL